MIRRQKLKFSKFYHYSITSVTQRMRHADFLFYDAYVINFSIEIEDKEEFFQCFFSVLIFDASIKVIAMHFSNNFQRLFDQILLNFLETQTV